MKFRPVNDPRQRHKGDDDPGGPVEWEDNWLSNGFAWASYRITPGWCQTPEHWTSKVANYLFTDCPCCLLFRGLALGLAFGALGGFLLALLVAWSWP